MGDDRSTNAIPTGLWVRRELVDALREALPDSYRPGMYVALHDAARSVVDAVEAEDEPKVPMTDLPDAETAWAGWFKQEWDTCDIDDDAHQEMKRTTQAAFLAGFAAASGPWADQLDAARTNTDEALAEAAKAGCGELVERLRADLAAALARNAELQHEVEGLAWRNQQLTERLEQAND